ncbi:hypothetical protein RMSM_07306 [Rhodopirellula maiorica SM1]|uniref:Glycosyl transferase family 28 C-terminal domain-containing protein n=1 Tax=Rhodopirellula maiorica SM1 TaxID=1265738 RepID=M5RPA7_9BACT|nr:hypothetical protein [Rhodopirellula maiorica]EMI15779.1 hypothetical protein RMSM_07306 [Rhodopirellula maiorica SM1]
MSSPTIGFYVHYHGLGHKHRTEAILQHLRFPATVITSRLDAQRWSGESLCQVIGIDCDIDDVHTEGLQHAADVAALHYAPLWCDTITRRVAQYTQWLHESKPDLMVVDVSAEISMLTRLASIPQIVMRQHGDRSDAAHENAYAAAHSLLAPFPETMEDDQTPQWVRRKTVYLDGFCRNTTSTRPESQVANVTDDVERPRIVVMFGRGGRDDVHEDLRQAAKRVPQYDWIVLGKEPDGHAGTPENLRFHGWVTDPTQHVQTAEIVVTAAGHNSVMEIGHARKRFVAIAEDRPFDEQIQKASVLDREGLAVGLTSWPDPQQWPAIVERAKALDPQKWDTVYRNDGARQAAEHLQAVATWSHTIRKRNCRGNR